jgi:hypothetical protein
LPCVLQLEAANLTQADTVVTLQQQLQESQEVIEEALQILTDQTDAYELALTHNTFLVCRITQVRGDAAACQPAWHGILCCLGALLMRTAGDGESALSER